MHRLEQLQATFDEGPCMDAYHSGRFAGAPDLVDAQARWPMFGPAALGAGIGATFSFRCTSATWHSARWTAIACARAR